MPDGRRLVNDSGGVRFENAAQRKANAKRKRMEEEGLPHDYPILKFLRRGEALMGFTEAQRAEVDRVGASVFGWPNEVGPSAGLAQPARGPPPGRNQLVYEASLKRERKKAKALLKAREKACRKGRKNAKKNA
jgi:hypothetical protein